MFRLEQDKIRLSAQLNQMLQSHKEIAAEKTGLEKSNKESTATLTDLNGKYLEIVKINSQLSEDNDSLKKELEHLNSQL